MAHSYILSPFLHHSLPTSYHYNFAHNPSLNPGPALKSATNIPGLRQPQCLTSIVLPLSIIIPVLPFSLPLQLCPQSLSQPRACPHECNHYPSTQPNSSQYLQSLQTPRSSYTYHYTFAHNPSLNPGPALKSATNIPGLRQLQCLTSIVLPLSIIITVLPFTLPLHLCPKSLSESRACPHECNQYKVLSSKMYIIFSRV